jgi:hypothetical protein
MHDQAEKFWTSDHATAVVLSDEEMVLRDCMLKYHRALCNDTKVRLHGC